MYTNATAIKLQVTENTDDEGYIKLTFVESGDGFAIDAQPYSSQTAQEEYGIQKDNIRYRCFSDNPIPMEEGEYIRVSDENYRVVLAHEWDYHTEFILQWLKGEVDG